MAKLEITGIGVGTSIKLDGEEVRDAFKYELSAGVEGLPVVKISVLVTELVVDAEDVEGLIERVPLVSGTKATADA